MWIGTKRPSERNDRPEPRRRAGARTLSGIVLLALALCAGASTARAQEPEVLTLERALEIALRDNRTLESAEIEVDKAGDRLDASRTKQYPSIKVQAVGSQNLTPIDFTFKQGTFGTFDGIGPVPATDTTISTPRQPTLTLVSEVSQPLSQLPRIRLGIKKARVDVELVREEASAKEQEIVASVKTAYYAILQTQSAIESTDETIKTYAELDRVTDESVTQQVVLRSDSLDVKARLAKAEYDASTLRDQLATQKERLNLLLGREVGADFRVSPTPEYSLFEVDLAAARAHALERRSEVREARLRAEQAVLDRKMKKAEYIPEVSLTFSHAMLVNYDSILPRQVSSAGITVNWEVFDWGRKRRELSEKDRAREQAALAVREAEASVTADVNDKHRRLEQTKRLVAVSRMRVEASREAVRVTTARYRARVALFKDALEAQGSLAAANAEYQQGLLSFWTAKADFEKAIGGK